QDRYRSCPR
ncbi:hypothetical protein VCHENC02_3992B, partial [Vibrio harveyi]